MVPNCIYGIFGTMKRTGHSSCFSPINRVRRMFNVSEEFGDLYFGWVAEWQALVADP